ncbi:ExeM/NucH family extracellular endonuclease [Deinococcus aestuarii]|uniref:ExeM/NucH family extracellular endonuclease n=1 Tax=Deinococcus aestuarii TaxID=2774531 RepID=UPI001C0B159E|nr:ExeM/NucH family extracellular endonuclease [Deinococcus aestuarii]
MRLSILALSCSLLLAACGETATPGALGADTGVQALAQKDAALAVKVPAEVKFVTAELSGGKLSSPRTFTATPRDGQATVVLGDLPNGDPKYQVVIRAFDHADRAVVLYRGTAEINTASGKTTTAPALTRVTATVTVTASPVLAGSTLTARLGDLSQSLRVEGEQATAQFTNVPTARGLTVTVQGVSADGQVTQQGEQTFNLSEGGAKVGVTLTAVASCPVAAGPITAIPAIQGSGATSPLLGQSVTVRGVVTGDYQTGLGGFFLQDAKGDGDAATSDGLFVFTGAAPQNVAPGDLVQFTGVVREFKAASDRLAATATQLDTLSNFTKCAGGLVVKPVEVKAPFNDLERYEGMLVTFPEKLTVTDNFGLGRYGELGLAAGGRLFNPTNGNVATTTAEQGARRIVLDDGSSRQNPATVPYLDAQNTRRTGDTVTGLTGVLRYGNDAFKVEPTGTVTFVNENPRQDKPKDVGGTLKVAGANVLNYFTTFTGADRGANSAYEFARQKAKVVAALKGLDADIVTLMEVQNNGDIALGDLVSGLNEAYGKETYAAVQTGVVGTDAIKVALIYKPARVTPVGSPVVDDNADNVYSRPPVAQTFQDKTTGGVLTVVANHLKSKGSCPTSGDVDTGQGCWNELRVQQAQKLLGFVDRLKTRSGDQDVLLMGDFNAYGDEDPIKAIVAGGFVSENKRVPAEDRYSYQFGGLFGYLDHALASTNLDTQVTGITEWHINADEPTFIDYNVEFKNNPNCTGTSCTTPDLYQPNAFRASDHDPVLIGLNLTRDEVRQPLGVTATGAASVTAGQAYTLSIGTNAALDSLKVNWGDGSAEETLAPTATGATHTFAAAGTFAVTVTATASGETRTATQSVTVNAVPTGGAKLVVSQVFGGGGNSGSVYKNDFIEIFNAGSEAVNLAGYSVQYASATGTSWQVTPLTSFNLAPGGYYLVQQAAGAGGTATLPTPDATGTINMSGSAGQVLIAEGTTAVTDRANANVRDYVSYSGLTTTTSLSRANGGCTDTDAAADLTSGAVAPRNSASPVNVCPK